MRGQQAAGARAPGGWKPPIVRGPAKARAARSCTSERGCPIGARAAGRPGRASAEASTGVAHPCRSRVGGHLVRAPGAHSKPWSARRAGGCSLTGGVAGGKTRPRRCLFAGCVSSLAMGAVELPLGFPRSCGPARDERGAGGDERDVRIVSAERAAHGWLRYGTRRVCNPLLSGAGAVRSCAFPRCRKMVPGRGYRERAGNPCEEPTRSGDQRSPTGERSPGRPCSESGTGRYFGTGHRVPSPTPAGGRTRPCRQARSCS